MVSVQDTMFYDMNRWSKPRGFGSVCLWNLAYWYIPAAFLVQPTVFVSNIHDDVIKWKHFRVAGHLCGGALIILQSVSPDKTASWHGPKWHNILPQVPLSSVKGRCYLYTNTCLRSQKSLDLEKSTIEVPRRKDSQWNQAVPWLLMPWILASPRHE